MQNSTNVSDLMVRFGNMPTGREPDAETITQSHIDKLTAHVKQLRTSIEGIPDSNSIAQSHVDELAAHVEQMRAEIRRYKEPVNQQCRTEARLDGIASQTQLRTWVKYVFGWRWAGVLLAASLTGGILVVTMASWKIPLSGAVVAAAISWCLLYCPAESEILLQSQQLRDELATLQVLNSENAQSLARLRVDLGLHSEKLRVWESLLRFKTDLATNSEKLLRWKDLLRTCLESQVSHPAASSGGLRWRNIR